MSPDRAETLKRFRGDCDLPFPLIADTAYEVIELYGARRLLGIVATRRVTYVIDRLGTIRAALQHELALARHRSGVLGTLRLLNELGETGSTTP